MRRAIRVGVRHVSKGNILILIVELVFKVRVFYVCNLLVRTIRIAISAMAVLLTPPYNTIQIMGTQCLCAYPIPLHRHHSISTAPTRKAIAYHHQHVDQLIAIF